jgi:nucleotide-binding universal stress UspA family protein
VLLVHAYALRLGEMTDQGRDRTRNILAPFVASAPRGLPVSVLVTEDEPVAALSRLAAGSSLLVIGGRTGPLSRRPGASIGQAVLEALPCPVLAVPRHLGAAPAGPLTGLPLVSAVPAPN